MEFEAWEQGLIAGVQWLRLVVEGVGAAVIAVGVILALMRLSRGVSGREARTAAFHKARLTLAHALALALEFQLAADVLSTAVAPTWDQIAKLAAIAVIRTGLNYFLTRELREVESAREA